MMFSRMWALLAVTLMTATHAHSQVDLDMDQTVHTTILGERDCVKADWQFAFLAKSSGLLKSESLPTHTCRAVKLLWLPSAQIVQVTGFRQTDVFVSETFVKADEQSPIRLVTALGGLVVDKNRENDDGNKAVFNELLRVSGYRPTEEQMVELGALYLFMVGHPPDESPRRLGDAMAVNDVEGMVGVDGEWRTVTVHQRTSLYGNPRSEWILKFHSEKALFKLVSVEPEGVEK